MPNTITPQTWTNGLFSVAEQIPAEEVVWSGKGTKLYTACPSGGVWCCEDSEVPEVGEPLEKELPATGQSLNFKPFNVYQSTGCSEGTSRIDANMDMNDRLALEWLKTNVEGWVSAGLELGACGSTGLIDLEDVTPDPVPDLSQAISRLVLNRQRDGLYDRPTVHVPAAAVPFISDYDMLVKFVNLAVGPGYNIVAPTDNVVSGGWAYITGTVQYALGEPPEMPPADDVTVRRRNYHDSLQEQLAVYRFDPCGGYRTQFKF